MRGPGFEPGPPRFCSRSYRKGRVVKGNQGLPHWQRDILPLNYPRIFVFAMTDI